jgi:hypothetical protein
MTANDIEVVIPNPESQTNELIITESKFILVSSV